MVGVDPDMGRIRVARDKHSASNLDYIEGSYESIPGRDYDFVFSNHVLHWCKDKENIFNTFSKVLKKKGKVGFVTGGYFEKMDADLTPVEIVTQKITDSLNGAQEGLHLVPREEYQALAKANDFEITYWTNGRSDLQYESVDELISIFSKSRVKSSQEKHILESHDIDLLKEHYGKGGICISYPSFIAVLVKK